MHQPNYQEPGQSRLAMPWVRLHALKDYLDMPLAAAEHEAVRVTFNLVPSLLDQLELYLSGGTDRHLELSRIRAEDLDAAQKLEILESFFVGYPEHMIRPYERYWELFTKARRSDGQKNLLPSLFTSVEMRDLQVWSNLVWIDPRFRSEEPIRSLLTRRKQFTEDEKESLLDWQLNLLVRIVPTYRRLYAERRIDISFTPYYHPILPLLCDTSVASEALPGIRLPERRFVHPEDARAQIAMAAERFARVFEKPLTGMWPSEGSVSEETLQLIADAGLAWTASDEEILYHSAAKSGLDRAACSPHRVYQSPTGVRLFFRDHGLSDRIGFVYSGWQAERAVADFIGHLKDIRNANRGSLEKTVVPIILDGENAWEYYLDDGREFLKLLYQTLAEDKEIRLVSMSDAAEQIAADPLPRLYAGSWINHNFRIWIGHAEDNAAWDLLGRTRETFEEQLRLRPDLPAATREAAWRQIYIAEGSDWCWWYGDDHRSDHRDQFDKIYRRHLVAVYELLGLDIPIELLRPIIGGQASLTLQPETVLHPTIDGRLTHFYEWTGAGFFDCRAAGGSMHRVDRVLTGIYFAYDHDHLFLRLDLAQPDSWENLVSGRIVIRLATPHPVEIVLERSGPLLQSPQSHWVRFACEDLLELAIARTYLWPDGHGPLRFSVQVFDGERPLELWPEGDLIETEVAPRHQEAFWPI